RLLVVAQLEVAAGDLVVDVGPARIQITRRRELFDGQGVFLAGETDLRLADSRLDQILVDADGSIEGGDGLVELLQGAMGATESLEGMRLRLDLAGFEKLVAGFGALALGKQSLASEIETGRVFGIVGKQGFADGTGLGDLADAHVVGADLGARGARRRWAILDAAKQLFGFGELLEAVIDLRQLEPDILAFLTALVGANEGGDRLGIAAGADQRASQLEAGFAVVRVLRQRLLEELDGELGF